MAKNEREACRRNYVDRWYPLVAAGLTRVTPDEFMQLYKQYMIDKLGSCTDEDIAWAKQHMTEIGSSNRVFSE